MPPIYILIFKTTNVKAGLPYYYIREQLKCHIFSPNLITFKGVYKAIIVMDNSETFDKFLALHKTQLEVSNVPQHLWKSLYRKLTIELFDAGKIFQLMLIEYDDDDDPDDDIKTTNIPEVNRPIYALTVTHENGIKADDFTAVYLIDHAWTFHIRNARNDLLERENLLNRMSTMMGINATKGKEERVEETLRRLWLYCQSYTFTVYDSEGKVNHNYNDDFHQSIWYIMDEVGSAVYHSDEPNFRIVPFLHIDTYKTYSLMFPIKDCQPGDVVTRDYLEFMEKCAPERSIFLLPWHYVDFSEYNFIQNEPTAEYLMSGHKDETYPKDENAASPLIMEETHLNQPLKVYAEYDVLINSLTSSSFVFVEDPSEADILWLTRHFKKYEEFSNNSSHKFINQFPFEHLITIKDLLSIVCRRSAVEHHNKDTLETYPLWLPTTYNLRTELKEFISYFQNRSKSNLDNHWIIKPWNLARSLDTYVTDNIGQILRVSTTGPKIAQKYIEQPVLFYRSILNAYVKFDIRYILLLKSIKPLEAYIHRKFYLRFANKQFTLDKLDDYEKHFTVMNYRNNGSAMLHMKCEEFLNLWHEQYPNYLWSELETKICKMLYEMLYCATSGAMKSSLSESSPPYNIASCKKSRAMYAVDIILEWRKKSTNSKDNVHSLNELGDEMQPKLLEVNWAPDCQRACEYYSDFFDDIFKLLFLNQCNDKVFRMLKK